MTLTTPTQASLTPSPHFPIVGIGASAGGLEACTRLLDVLPADSGMAFVLVQHLDPSHDSLMVELLAKHTQMRVLEVSDGILIEPDHLYVIPPGTYLAAENGALHLTQPLARHGARLPFDFLLNSLAQQYGAAAVGIILSGTGADGSIGLKAIKDNQGLVIAQDPDEAEHDGMPRSAIAAGAVDLVLPIIDMPAALANHGKQLPVTAPPTEGLPEIVELLRTTTGHDFRLYKMGTIRRRIERRIALSSIKPGNMINYLEKLRNDAAERDLLANDLLINVTSFFRDPEVFATLGKTVIPDLVTQQLPDMPLRVWVAGCSTGEEAYSLAILLHEAMVAADRLVRVQVFASDIDADAVATAREGLYPHSISAEVSPERLAQFFIKEELGYRVTPELRKYVIFTVQDVLGDPPFSRLDLISCRNLLIYLGAEAQNKVISLFNFALRDGGILLLGNAENIGAAESHFKPIAKAERIYRHIGRPRSGDIEFPVGGGEALRTPPRISQAQAVMRQKSLAQLSERLMLEHHVPAGVLINRKLECLYSLGPIDRYLRVAPGHPSHDLLSMAPTPLRIRLRAAIQEAGPNNSPLTATGGRLGAAPFNIVIHTVMNEGEELLLVCFIDAPAPARKKGAAASPQESARIADLERELEATRAELQSAIHNLEMSSEEQRAINEEALSVNEEFQSTNEELLTSKEELQSLNEELTALNTQLQETLERQRATANDLQNILYSTDVATLFLDKALNISFFTPATKSLFNIIPGDIGRPLSDLHSLAADTALLDDARTVLDTESPIDREIETASGVFFGRRIMPYRTDDDHVDGVVITFTDITDRKRAAKLLAAAQQDAEVATIAKSRFLAVASHDLRQPLQTLTLLQGLLAKEVSAEKPHRLVTRMGETLGAMSGMLNALLDINQIESGMIQPEISIFPVDDLLNCLRDEFSYHAQAKKISLRVVPCSIVIATDHRLLEQMLRNLITNALKYTNHGKVLLGCRRRPGAVSIEVLDTGIGIEESQMHAIFEEYHQVENNARERSRGLGLGLSIVQRLGELLGHPVHVRSKPGKGSTFAVEIELPETEIVTQPAPHAHPLIAPPHRRGTILIVEDEPEVRDLLDMLMRTEGHRVLLAINGDVALKLLAAGGEMPDLVLTDHDLPGNLNGVKLAARLRTQLGAKLPIIILTGDISAATMREVKRQNCVQFNKPVNVTELSRAIQRMLPLPTLA